MTPLSVLLADLQSGKVRSVDVVAEALARIAAQDGTLHAVTNHAPDAMDQARLSDQRRAAGHAGPLEGIPVAVKDNIDVAGLPTTNGTRHFANAVAATDATTTARLRAAGAVILAKLNMHEGALGATTDNAFWGRCDNPAAPGHTPGGSSGGSAAAVAAGYVPLALGSDTMGSVRIPAAYCGLWGLKPTRGLIGRGGLSFLSRSLDTIGPLGHGPQDLALALSVLAGPDDSDPATLDCPTRPRAIPDPMILGIPAFPETLLTDEVARAFDSFVHRMTRAGVTLQPVTVPGWTPATLRRAGLVLSEAEAADLLAPDLAANPEGFSPGFRALLDYGRRADSPRLMAALRLLDQMRPAVLMALHGVHALLLPTAPQTAFRHGAPIPANQADLTALANAAGLPAVAFPIPSTGTLPVSAQLIGRPFDDATLIEIAGQLTRYDP